MTNERAKDILECHLEDLRKKVKDEESTVNEALKVAISVLAKTSKPYERFLPCVCGCNRRGRWYGTNTETGKRYVRLICEKCGRSISGTNETTAKRNWNNQMRASRDVIT